MSTVADSGDSLIPLQQLTTAYNYCLLATQQVELASQALNDSPTYELHLTMACQDLYTISQRLLRIRELAETESLSENYLE